MLIVFEGPDGSGKSTLAEKVYRKTCATFVHQGPPPLGRALDTFACAIAWAQTHPAPVVFDRLHWGDYPYGTLYRSSELGLDKIAALDGVITDEGGLVVYVHADAAICNARLAARGPAKDVEEAKYEDASKMSQIVALYDEVAALSMRRGNNVMVINNNSFSDPDVMADAIIAVALEMESAAKR